MFVCLFDCEQYSGKTPRWISTKLGGHFFSSRNCCKGQSHSLNFEIRFRLRDSRVYCISHVMIINVERVLFEHYLRLGMCLDCGHLWTSLNGSHLRMDPDSVCFRTCPDPEYFSPNKVESLLSNLDSDSTTRPDDISPNVLKTCSTALVKPSLCSIHPLIPSRSSAICLEISRHHCSA